MSFARRFAEYFNHTPSLNQPVSINQTDDEPPPQKKMRISIGSYVYWQLFKRGTDSDVTLVAKGTEWKLHKTIIKHSPYLSSLISVEPDQPGREVINLPIDEGSKITVESLDIIFGVLYEGDLFLTAANVHAVLAAAKLILPQKLRPLCIALMNETINQDTVIEYYKAATIHELHEVKKNVMHWLTLNILYISSEKRDFSFLRDISAELMSDILSSPSLFVWYGEYCIYRMLLKWLYLKLGRSSGTSIDDFYGRRNRWQPPLLETDEGKQYILPFKTIRMKFLLSQNIQDMKCVKKDNVLPKAWIDSANDIFWEDVMKMRRDNGFRLKFMSEDGFEKSCLRASWIVPDAGREHSYDFRDDVYSLGFELILRSNKVIVTRNRREKGQRIYIPWKKRRVVMLKVSFVGFDGRAHTKVVQESKLLTLFLDIHEEAVVMDYSSSNLTFPLRMMVKILTTVPINRY